MTTPHLAGHPAASQQAILDAALLMLQQMGLSPDDLAAAPQDRLPVPTFAEYVPVVSAAVTDGTRRAYGSYWNRIIGFGGSGGWADPRRDLALAMVCNRGTGTPIGDFRIAELGAAVIRAPGIASPRVPRMQP